MTSDRDQLKLAYAQKWEFIVRIKEWLGGRNQNLEKQTESRNSNTFITFSLFLLEIALHISIICLLEADRFSLVLVTYKGMATPWPPSLGVTGSATHKDKVYKQSQGK